MHENREISFASARADRSGKANNRTPDMHAVEKSDCAVVPMKLANKEAQASAELVEGRARTKENDVKPNTHPTQSGTANVLGVGRSCVGKRYLSALYPR